MSQYFKIGKFVASHGLNGDLVLQHSLGRKTALKDVKALFIEEQPGNFMPYFIEKATAKTNDETWLKIEGIDTKESARRLTPKEIWLLESDFNQHTASSSPIAFLGYSMIDGETDLGEIIEVIEQPHQILCTILYNGNEALIPVHEASLIKIDKKNRKVYVDIPEGLLDIYA